MSPQSPTEPDVNIVKIPATDCLDSGCSSCGLARIKARPKDTSTVSFLSLHPSIPMSDHSSLPPSHYTSASGGLDDPPSTPPLSSEPAQPSQDTPPAYRMAGHLGHTSTPLNQVAAFKDELAREMKGHFVGPLSPDDFLNDFLPDDGPDMPEVSAEAFSTVTDGRNERDMYDSFVRARLSSFDAMQCNYFFNTG